ncbi:hypothetical protein BT67DRAFT_377869 [Trichocladium antarcticum]|uniref:Riboflavin kinase n=1 Tax=Trichocladium antarcticum TaxID=1450529 RepID=A0AAN6UM17_9PEZI|nr:hypothetical protein BT67DRAFT_377869 [Trichocladium antarcticum]
MQTSLPDLSRFTDPPSPSPSPSTPGDTSIGAAATFGPSISDSKTNFMQNVLSEARHFAGGLLPHPTESTKHYTILRHSPPLIFYRGPATSVAITIFSSPDRPLPADRTLWLQQRGFSGDSGMKIKAFFNATDSWLHVTPSTQMPAPQLAPGTERAWQRDMGKAARSLVKEKGEKKAHLARETHVVRIPETSDDGYFRLILCTGSDSKRKTLCTSPIFRVASASIDASSLRGASLSTLPLEMGVFVASVAATATFDRYTAPIRAPVGAVANRIRPGLITGAVGAFLHDGLSERSNEQNAERDQAHYAAHQTHVARSLEADNEAIYPIGPDSGPETPFPLKFYGKVVRGTGRSEAELGIPTANLTKVPDEIQYRLNGIYFGWACVTPPQDTLIPNQNIPTPNQLDPFWHEAIITIGPDPLSRPSVTPIPLTTVHLLQAPASSLVGTNLKVIILGLLRPPPSPLDPPLPLRARLDAASRDVCLTLVSLARENWQPEAAAAELQRKKSDRNLGERFGGVKEKVAKKLAVPNVPLHWVGVRSGAGQERDRVLGQGGYWVAR